MKKIFDFFEDEMRYTLQNTNPNDDRIPFIIEKETMEFNSESFYEYVFSDITGDFEIEVNLLQSDLEIDSDKKQAKRVCDTIQQICTGVIEEMKKRHI